MVVCRFEKRLDLKQIENIIEKSIESRIQNKTKRKKNESYFRGTEWIAVF